jgi:hypothetical protein
LSAGVVDYSTLRVRSGPAHLLPLASDRPVPRGLLWGAFALGALLYALLWTPNWYPLSDSSLYLVMARGLMQGRGIGFLRQVHRDVRPLTPLLIFTIMKCGGGIGTIQAVMTLLTLVSHVLAFLTLRRWFNERVALLAVIASAGSWWVYANAFTIMTEPLFLIFFWGCLLVLSHVPGAPPRKQWALVVLGALMLLGAFENRIAAVLLIPGTLFGLWMQNGGVKPIVRVGWILVFVVIFALAYVEWKRPFAKAVAGQVNNPNAGGGGAGGIMASAEGESSGPEVYRLNALVDVTNPLVQLPVSAGRWVAEGLAMVSAFPFDGKKPMALQLTAGLCVFILFLITCAGWFRLIRGQQWYAVGMAAYFFPYWIMWGNRLKPRYMAPILPLIFIQLWAGLTLLFWLMQRSSKAGTAEEEPAWRRTAAWTGGATLGMVLLLNAIPYGIDFYVRHASRLNFYDVARRGAFAELVDIGAYLEKNTPRDAQVWMNYGPNRRVVGFLSDRDFRVPIPAKKRGTGDIPVRSPADRASLNAYFANILKADPRAEWAVVFYSQNGWPIYHLPLAKDARTSATPPRWWQLYHREQHGFVPVTVPVDREGLRNVPGIKARAGVRR